MDKIFNEENLLPLSGIQHYAYCPRQWALIHIEGQWAENLSTAQGRLVHKRVDDPFLDESRGDSKTERSIPLVSQKLGLFGVADLLEIHHQKGDFQSGYTLVEYKKGKPKPDDRDTVQLCAQAICLEEMKEMRLKYGCIYYDQIKHRHQVEFDTTLRDRVRELAKNMHYHFDHGLTPAAPKSSRCDNCSLKGICLPKLTKKKKSPKKYMADYLKEISKERIV